MVAKRTDLMHAVKECVRTGNVRYTYHAETRRADRCVSPLDVKHALLDGYHEPAKDKFDSRYGAWNYAIRGKTIDGEKIRVVVTFAEPNLAVVTVIRLEGQSP